MGKDRLKIDWKRVGLGTMPDDAVASIVGCYLKTVRAHRHKLKIAPFGQRRKVRRKIATPTQKMAAASAFKMRNSIDGKSTFARTGAAIGSLQIAFDEFDRRRKIVKQFAYGICDDATYADLCRIHRTWVDTALDAFEHALRSFKVDGR